jgi:hypothetical protein
MSDPARPKRRRDVRVEIPGPAVIIISGEDPESRKRPAPEDAENA